MKFGQLIEYNKRKKLLDHWSRDIDFKENGLGLVFSVRFLKNLADQISFSNCLHFLRYG